PAAQVSVTQLSESTYGADGCGQRTVYTLKCPRGAMAESECNLAREPSPPTPLKGLSALDLGARERPQSAHFSRYPMRSGGYDDPGAGSSRVSREEFDGKPSPDRWSRGWLIFRMVTDSFGRLDWPEVDRFFESMKTVPSGDVGPAKPRKR
ncbi:MAG: hypothetical protein MUF34_22825, partial [Polyangiaceae bacterium]|nr:hypothetical protein [Polyangiaceae bacterium]